ncbi:MAG TPA: serine hydrolase [Gemmatimonadales bacterium]|nr:serine hydrolase [Gemmatimonadales bacterium]
MKTILLGVALLGSLAPASLRSQSAPYYPGRHPDWERRTPAQVGMSAALLDSAVAFAKASETPGTRDLEQAHHLTFGREPHGEPIGPFKPRGDPAGMIVRHGYIVAEWGDADRVDMTFSVTKSFLSTVVGLAFDQGLIPDLSAPVHPSVTTGEFDSPHNRTIAWEHLLRQTSDWEGTLWGKPDWADRPPRDQPLAEYVARTRNPPGTTYKYNDVRVNALAYAALMVWRRPLPQVLRERVMDPIGASNTWRWYGYDNSWVNLDGVMVQSVSGGGHWGGGMFISAHDQARFGLLTLRRGRWRDRQILSERWVALALTPTPVQDDYGFMNWYLNTGRRRAPSAPASSFCHLGSGTNMICGLPEYDLVVVARWIRGDAIDGLLRRVIAAVGG